MRKLCFKNKSLQKKINKAKLIAFCQLSKLKFKLALGFQIHWTGLLHVELSLRADCIAPDVMLLLSSHNKIIYLMLWRSLPISTKLQRLHLILENFETLLNIKKFFILPKLLKLDILLMVLLKFLGKVFLTNEVIMYENNQLKNFQKKNYRRLCKYL